MSEHKPHLTVGSDEGYGGHAGELCVYGNREGLETLRDLITAVLDGKSTGRRQDRVPVRGSDSGWWWLAVDLDKDRDEEDDYRCNCGCQDEIDAYFASRS